MLRTVRNYIQVVKPGIILGNLISTAGGFFLASGWRPETGVLAAVLAGTALMVASGCVFNNCIDRKPDGKMARTRNRVLASGRMSPAAALLYGASLGLAGAALLLKGANPLCLGVVMAGYAIYVIVYSLILKPRWSYSILVGSLAGAAPPLAGYCAVTHQFDPGALILLSIFCVWQIPHAHAIAVYRLQDYTAAAIPSLPGKRGIPAAKKHILIFILAFLATAPMLTIGGYAGSGFLSAATLIGALWLLMALQGIKATDDRLWAKKLFVFSIVGITILSVMMAIDCTVHQPPVLQLTWAM